MFHFKQFSVDQTGCAMKINTDGVLLGAMAEADAPASILDIGTGTGVIALMLAQRYADAVIDGVEIDPSAAQTANKNFGASPFARRLKVYPAGFEDFFDQYGGKKYDLVVSNPPFYTNSLKSPGAKKAIAKHTDINFFEKLVHKVAGHLTVNGYFWVILPPGIAETVVSLGTGRGLSVGRSMNIQSYEHSQPHRVILCFGFNAEQSKIGNLIIYRAEGVYSAGYKKLLQPYFLAF